MAGGQPLPPNPLLPPQLQPNPGNPAGPPIAGNPGLPQLGPGGPAPPPAGPAEPPNPGIVGIGQWGPGLIGVAAIIERLIQQQTHQHHIFPQEFRHDFEDCLGIPIDDFTIPLPAWKHWDIHPAWNDDWDLWLAEHPNATAWDAAEYAAELIYEYGLEEYVPEAPFGE